MTEKNRPQTIFSGHDLLQKSALEVVGLLQKGEVSSQELIEICASRINETDAKINATPILCKDRALNAAQTTPRNSPLAGMPIAIKDLSAVKDVRSSSGTKGLADFVPDVSDPIVRRLETSGGIVLGKTNTPEFGAGANTFNDVFGPTLNPWDTRKNAAGSSGGAAASLATGQFWLAHGSDHAGSLRTPAAYCGIVGMRPSPGRTPNGGLLGFAREGVQGPMARSVMDCALFLDAMSGFQADNPISFPAPERSFLETTQLVESNRKIAYSPTLNGYSSVETQISDVYDMAMKSVTKDGATVADACPDIKGLEVAYRTLRAAMWAATVGRMPPEIQDHLKDTLRENIDFGRQLTIDDINDANLARSRIFNAMNQFFETHDVLATAVVGCPPKDISIEYPTKVAGEPMDDYISWLKFAFLSTTTGLPSLSLPVGFTDDGLPVGLQLIGPHRGEAKLLQVAAFIEASLNLPNTPIDPITQKSTP